MSLSYLPTHLAIIMDGNGRWAQAKNLSRTEGHIAGVEAVKRTIKACLNHHIKIISLFAFSSENWGRPLEEVNALMQLFSDSLSQEANALHEHQVSLRFLGNLSQLSPSLQSQMAQVTQATAHHTRLIVNIMINYGGKWDILQAAQKLAQHLKDHSLEATAFSEDTFASYLSTAALPDPDLFIRTSGEHRLSNFFLWQLAYTELYFTPILWPDFDESHLKAALQDFQTRHRRFGQLHSQD